MGGLGVGSAVQRHSAAPLDSVADSHRHPNGSHRLAEHRRTTPILRGQLHHLQPALARQMNTPSLLLKPFGAALRTHDTQQILVSAIERTAHKQLMDTHADNPTLRAILISQTAKKNTGAHLQQTSHEARSGRQMLSGLTGATT